MRTTAFCSVAAVLITALFAGIGSGQSTTLYTFNGLAAGDGFGISVAGAGDVNQDGWADLIVGAYNADPGSRADAGQATVFSGRDGSALYTLDGVAAGDWFGWSVAGAGDVNQDGFPDVVVGAYQVDRGALANCGRASVFSGKDGGLLHAFDGLAAGDEFGIAVAGADVNRDGHADLIVGAYKADPGARANAGQVTVFSGKDWSVLHTFDGAAAGDEFGWAVAAADVNGDGHADIIVGADSADPDTRASAGQVTVFSGKDWSVLHTFDGAAAGDHFGMAVAGSGDVNRDGYADIIVGAYRADPGGRADAGQVTVFSGKDWSVIRTFEGAAIGDHFGRSVGAADVNRDGYADVIVGADNAAPGGRAGAGRAAVFSGRNGALLCSLDGPAAGDCVGVSVAAAGDVNRDGWADVVVGADMADPLARMDAGRATVVSVHGLPWITGTGSGGVGGTVTLSLSAPGDGHLPYQVGSSFGAGPIPLDTRLLHLGADALLVVSVQGFLPAVFSRYSGILDPSGKSTAVIRTPNITALVGTRIHSAFLTIKQGAPSNIESVSNTFYFDVTK